MQNKQSIMTTRILSLLELHSKESSLKILKEGVNNLEKEIKNETL